MRVCVLRSGGEYSAKHVQWLSRQVTGLHCLSDVDVPGVPTIPLRYDWPGWWAKLEICRPDIPGDVLYFDLDTVALSVPEVSETTVLADFYHKHLVGSGFMYITERDRARVWAHFMADPERHIRECTRWPRHGDQAIFGDVLSGTKRWGSNVVSYKAHCRRGVTQGADVICFHGKPRPWDAREDWIPAMDTTFGDYRDLILQYSGKRILVMGGGASLESDLERAPKCDVVISANGHGAQHPHDYLLAMDDQNGHNNQPMVPFLRSVSDKPIIGPQRGTDYHLFGWPLYPRRLFTGNSALWLAWQMGAKVVILAGVDGYGASPNYTRQIKEVMKVVTIPVRALSGGLFPAYDPKERFGRYTPDPAITTEIAESDDTVTVEVVKGCGIDGVRRMPGYRWTGPKIRIKRLLRAGVVRATT